jgi:carboxyl-terminal processing protease
MVKTKLLLFIISAILLTGCEDMIVSTENSNLNVEDFNAAWERVNTVYPYLELKKINWDSLYFVYKPRAKQAKGDEIYPVLIDMLGELKDMHVEVGTPGGRLIETYQAPRWLRDKYSYDPIVVRNYFDKELKITGEGNIEFEITPGNIGYIYIGSFNVDNLKDPFYEAVKYVKHTKALILDIRHNNGGSTQHVETIVNRFITSTLEKPESYLLGELRSSTPFKPQGPFQYVNPVVVLINGVCVSAGDYLPEVMKQISTVTVVGDTTAGASAGATLDVPAQYELPSGKKIFVGTLDLRRYDGLPWEWIGIAPDILVEQTREDLEDGKDKQLEYAINMLKD